MRCCCGSSIRHRPKYGREREKSLPVGSACGQYSRPLDWGGKITEKPYPAQEKPTLKVVLDRICHGKQSL